MNTRQDSNFSSDTNCSQREYLPWDVIFNITKPKFLMASQIRETLLLHILLQDFQPNLLGYRKTMINSVAFDSVWEFRVMCFWLRKCDGHRIWKKVVSHLRPSCAISGLLVMARAGLTDSIWGQMNLDVLYKAAYWLYFYCALKLSFTACRGVTTPTALFPLSYQYSRQCH